MICYNCGLKIHNIDTAECYFCGVKFGNPCIHCQTPNPPMAKFCCHCGSQMLSCSETGSIQNYATLGESRKHVAVLFADVSGFTALSERLDPELVREIINDCFTYITTPVYELGGTIDKYIGDCVMVLFGAKTSHIDDAKRAVLCALKMAELIKEFSAQRIKALDFDLQLSIGVHYGLVVTGRVGNYYDMDYTVMGDTVNTAQRIQSSTPTSSIYVSDAIFVETQKDILYSQPLSIMVKNKENPITCYVPQGIINPLSSVMEPIYMVGRHSILNQLFEALEASKQNSNFLIEILGPAGIGKSTLVEEFLKLNKESLKIIRTECNPTLVNSPYSLISSLLMNIMNINRGESVIVKQSRIISYISFIMSRFNEEQVKRNYQFISFMMGLEIDKETRDILSSMDSKSMFRELAAELHLLLGEIESKSNTVILIEDINWGDSRSIDLLLEVWRSMQSRKGKMLYIYTTGNKISQFDSLLPENYIKLTLSALDKDTVLSYIKLYFDCEAVDQHFADYVYEFCEGNPLYMHELLKYIKKIPLFQIIKGTVHLQKGLSKVPNSLQGLILSKLNYMSQEATEITQAASVIGKHFPLAVINKLFNKDVELSNYLLEAVNSNIVYSDSSYTYNGRIEKIYSFAHETERETIYESMLNKEKTHYHRETAKAIESLYSRNIENYYEVLGEHFEKGQDYLKAADYYSNAAQYYKNLFNTQEALSYSMKSYHCLTKIKPLNTDKAYMLCIQIGEFSMILSDFQNAKKYLNIALKHASNPNETWAAELDMVRIYKDQSKYKQALKILDSLQEQMKKNHSLYGSLLFLKCSIQRVIGQSQEALANIKIAEDILLKNKDYANLAKVLNAAGIIYHTTSDIDNALKYYMKAYKYSEKMGDLQTLMKCAANMATIYHIQGNMNNAMKYFNAAMDLSKKISHRQGYVTSSNNLGILYMGKGMFNKARALFEEAAKISKETSTLFMQSASLSNLADIEYYLGDYKAAKRLTAQALDISREIQDLEGEGINYISLAKINLEQAHRSVAKEHLDAAYKIYSSINSEDGWSDYYYYLAQYYLQLEQTENALEAALKSKDFALKSQNSRKHAKTLRLIGFILLQQLKYSDAMLNLNAAIELLEKEEAHHELAKCYFIRAKLHHVQNRIEASTKDLKAAEMNIKKIDKCKWTKIIEHGIN